MFDVYPELPHIANILNTITLCRQIKHTVICAQLCDLSSSHAVPRVTLSPVNITVPESAGMVTIQVIRSGDITGFSRVFFNTRSTATTTATGK